ncbi:hypothetical protein H6P81_004971 [Aristolochia fimbriata]|uniref:Ribosomal protein S11 n=1 Tax=Aristolochia fimbriata TaxID=158543 RepID=A0AAV7EWQ2_ARIFI|nr:hypothetical protein H6P81_004971 [Aristolochia fimbriata]
MTSSEGQVNSPSQNKRSSPVQRRAHAIRSTAHSHLRASYWLKSTRTLAESIRVPNSAVPSRRVQEEPAKTFQRAGEIDREMLPAFAANYRFFLNQAARNRTAVDLDRRFSMGPTLRVRVTSNAKHIIRGSILGTRSCAPLKHGSVRINLLRLAAPSALKRAHGSTRNDKKS